MTQVRRYLTWVKTTVSSKGQIVLPAEIRERDNVKPGEKFEIERLDRGEYRLKRVGRSNRGLVDHLLACPVKDWFVPLDRSETTEDLETPDFG
jgi:AbrB family looped-hinge helix DNA binding protein